jgi:hypothetical protein
MTAFGLGALAGPLAPATRRSLERSLRALLAWQHRLAGFPRVPGAPDATPIVSLYADGRLAGCSLGVEGSPGERVVRAFVLALGDARYGGIGSAERARLTAQVAYPLEVRRVSLDAALRVIAPGAHGVALSNGDGLPAVLVPEVAREHELDTPGLLAALESKAGLPRAGWRPDGLFAFTTERVIARPRVRGEGSRRNPVEAGVRFLAGLVSANGTVAFGREPRTGRDVESGPFRHGRAAAVVQALGAHPAGRDAARRARGWLEREIRAGLGRNPPADWPKDAPGVAGTLALATLAGVDVREQLGELARRADVVGAPWNAAQVAYALGDQTPERLWRTCLRSLEREPRAPWLAMAAVRRNDTAVFERIADALAASVREHGPHRGGVGAGMPELALTAVTVEALATAGSEPHRRARELARAFVSTRQLLGDLLPEATAPERLHGAFPLTPVHAFLRADVTAHAVLALAPRG